VGIIHNPMMDFAQYSVPSLTDISFQQRMSIFQHWVTHP